MKQILFPLWVVIAILFALPINAKQSKQHLLSSPNGEIQVEVSLSDTLKYRILCHGKALMEYSPIGLQLEEGLLGLSPRIENKKIRGNKESIVSPLYRTQAFNIAYNELDFRLRGGYGVVFRAYDDGIAYRFYTTRKQSLHIMNEVASMRFSQAYTAYLPYSTAGKGREPYAMSFQNLYTKVPLSQIDTTRLAFLPLTVDCGDGVKLTLLESDLEAYPGMFVKGDAPANSFHAVFAPYPATMAQRPPRAMTYVASRTDYIAQTNGPRTFPWRIWAVTTDDRQMPVNNLVYALASPNRIGDTSWIKPGKVAWDWWNDWGIYGVDFKAGINMPTYKHYIDFAAENGIEFVVLDEGWYDPSKGDMLTVIPELDLEELVAYGKQKGVDLILWTVFNVLDSQLEAACKKYSEMGISGFKVDFMDRDDQTAVEMVYRIAEATSRYKLTLDLHGIYKPTGINRTYPHIINIESVFGMEEMKWSKVEKDMMEYDVTFPYIRMMAGPVDYTPGAMRNATKKNFKDIYYNPMSQGTRCHQLAAYIVHDSPLTMLADNPTIYRKEQECTSFICSIPNAPIEETHILQGELGEYIVTARRIGNNWYVGGMTNWSQRIINLKLDFLPEGSYELTLFKDGINANKQAEDYQVEKKIVKINDILSISMAQGGGFALSLLKKDI